MINCNFGFLSIIIVFAAGCGSREFVPVSGSVELEGKPLEGATVTFHCKEKDSYSVGQTNANGEFKLATSTHEGAVPGEHMIMVSKMVLEEHMNTPPGKPKPEGPDPKGRFRSVVPPKYSDFNKSGLSEKVTESGPNNFKLILK